MEEKIDSRCRRLLRMALVSSELSSVFFRFRFLAIFWIRVFSHSDGFFKLSIHLIWALRPKRSLLVIFLIDALDFLAFVVFCEETSFSSCVFSSDNGCYKESPISLSLNFLGKVKFSGKEEFGRSGSGQTTVGMVSTDDGLHLSHFVYWFHLIVHQPFSFSLIFSCLV